MRLLREGSKEDEHPKKDPAHLEQHVEIQPGEKGAPSSDVLLSLAGQ